MQIKIIGGGLAGSEAAYHLAKLGYEVLIYEMRPTKMTPAHQTADFGELVCSNSLKSSSLENACGILKAEMEEFDSLVMQCAKMHSVPAGQSLSVDREAYAKMLTNIIKSFPNIKIINEEVTKINPDEYTIIATGPLTSDSLAEQIKELFGLADFYFYDAQAPIIYADSIDYNKAYFKSRYDKGSADYLNCPFTKEEFDRFYDALITAEEVPTPDFELKVFEACMPIEVMAKRGPKTLTFGPMKPVGLRTPDGVSPYAVVQLRQDDVAKTMFNIVGFQTHLKFGEQKRVFSMIPGLENVRFAKYGRIHKNTYINAPKILNNTLQTKKFPKIFFAGQLSGVEGYVESFATGIVAALNMDLLIQGKELLVFPPETMIGSLLNYISQPQTEFVPMNANFGIVPSLTNVNKKERKKAYGTRALAKIKEMKDLYDSRRSS